MYIEDFVYIPLLILLMTLFFYLPGKHLLRIIGAPYQGLLGLAMSTMTGMVVMPYVYNIGFVFFHFTTLTFYLLSVFTLGFTYLLAKQIKPVTTYVPLFLTLKSKYIAGILIVPLMVLFFIAYPHIRFFNNKLTQTVITDSDKHFAMVTSLLTSEKFPPQVSFTRLSHNPPLRYYYFYYLLSATLIGGLFFHPHIPTVFAVVSSLSVGLLLILLAGIAKGIFRAERAGLWALVIGYASGVQIFNLAYLLLVQHHLEYWPADLDDMAALVLKIFATGADSTPQHFFASGIFLLMIALFLYAKNKKGLIVLLALFHASLLFFSFYLFIAVTFTMILYGGFMLFEEYIPYFSPAIVSSYLRKMKRYKQKGVPFKRHSLQSIFAIILYFFSFCLFVYPLYRIMSHAGDPTPIFSVFQFIYVDFTKSPIFGQKRHISSAFGWSIISFTFWYVLYFFERYGILLVGGIAGIWHYRKQLYSNKPLRLLFFGGAVTYSTIHFMKLPGPQNEYAKDATLLITYSLGIFMAGFFTFLFQIKKGKQTLSRKVVSLIFCVLLIISVTTGIWEYYFAVGYVKMQLSNDDLSLAMPEVDSFLHDTPRNTVVFSDKYLTWIVNNYAAKKVNLSPLGPYTLGFARDSNDWVNNYQSINIFDTGPFDKSLWEKLHIWHSEYIVMCKYDLSFPNRNHIVDKKYFKKILATKQVAIYEVR